MAARAPRHSSGQIRFRALRLFGAWTEREVVHLDPGCFAIVMATGIISNAFFLEGRRGLSDGLLAVNLAVYAWLCVATGVRAARFPAALWADLASPRLVFSFFTIVAATDVLALGIDLRGFVTVALFMWLVAFAVWLILIFLGFGPRQKRHAGGVVTDIRRSAPRRKSRCLELVHHRRLGVAGEAEI